MSTAKRTLSTSRDRAHETMGQRNANSSKTPTRTQIVGGERGEDRQRTKCRRQSCGHFLERGAGSFTERGSRLCIATMATDIDKRPKSASGFCALRIASQQPRADAEEDSPTMAHTLNDLFSPRKRFKQRQPSIFELCKLSATDAAFDQLSLDRLDSRLSRSVHSSVEFLEPLSPPCHADSAERRLRRACDYVGKCQVDVPERRESRPYLHRRRFERRQPIRIEPPLSDSRLPSPPRRPRTP